MIFSGCYEERACVSCGDLRSRVTPTSLMFFMGLAAVGLAVISQAHGVILEARWWHWPVGLIGELVLTLTLLSVGLWLRDALLPMPDTCPSCSKPMVPTATGFFDFAFFPSPSEVILLVVFVGLHVAFLAWLSSGEGIANGGLVTLLPFFWTPPRNAPALSPENW